MASKEKQSKVGRSTKLRGQQTGRPDTVPDQEREAKQETPALRGRRKNANQFFADKSSQQVGSDGATPRSNTPSVPAAMPSGQSVGESGGEKVFKQRQKRAAKSGKK